MLDPFAYFTTHPLRTKMDRRATLISAVRQAEHVNIHPTDLHPTVGAFIHYGGVELVDRLVMLKPQISEADAKTLHDLWWKSCGGTARQLLYYVWHIISRELRHGNSGMTSKAVGAIAFKDAEVIGAVNAVCSSSSNYMGAVDGIGHREVGLYVDLVEAHYRHGGWSGAFGGKKWADIALTFKNYLDGDASAMVAADRAWTLVHNCGPIFNKGMYFTIHDGNLEKVLNHQASDSVFNFATPEAMTDKYSNNSHPFLLSFNTFADAAVAAIKTVDPDYHFGKGGAVNSDGTKVAEAGFVGKKKGKGAGKFKGTKGSPVTGSKSLGPFDYAFTTREAAE